MAIDTSTASVWRPVFSAREGDRIDAIVSDVARSLREPRDEWLFQRLTEGAPRGWELRQLAALLGGWSGIALLHGYRHLQTGHPEDRAAALTLLERAVDALAEGVARPDLSAGFTGVGWAVQHLQRTFGLEDEGDLVESVDEALATLLASSRPLHSYDLISGLAGWGVYCIERGPGTRAAECFTLIVDRLEALAEKSGPHACWFTPPQLLPEHQRKTAPDGYYNIGMAHGGAGVLAMLGLAHASGLADERIPDLVTSGTRWILDQPSPTDPSLRFANWIARGDHERHSRFAWCYGDPGVVAGLAVAARGVGDRECFETMLTHARRIADLTIERSDVRDAGLCHGAASLGHIFNRFFQATGEACFADAARFWLRRTLELRAPGAGIAGFRSYRHRADGSDPWVTEAGFLTGACGTALALQASISDVVPAWDRLLLTSIP